MKEFFELVLPMLAVVLIIVAAYFATRWIAKRQSIISSGRIIKIIEQVMISRDTSLVVVKIGDKVYLMSVSSGRTELLTELPPELAESALPEKHALPEFKNILNSFINMNNHNKNNQNGGGDK